MTPDPTPCELPSWPKRPALGGVPEEVDGKQTGRAFITPDGIADWGRFVAGATAYYDANERCRKARSKP